MSQPDGNVPQVDITMDVLYSWAEELGPPPTLPDSLKDVQYTSAFIERADREIINPFRNLGKEQFILKVAELTREKIPDVADGNIRANITLRLCSGCLDSAKTIRDTSVDGFNPDGTPKLRLITPEERETWHKQKQLRWEEDALFKYGVELGTIFMKIRKQQVYLEGIPSDSIVRRYIRKGKEGNVISPEDIVTS